MRLDQLSDDALLKILADLQLRREEIGGIDKLLLQQQPTRHWVPFLIGINVMGKNHDFLTAFTPEHVTRASDHGSVDCEVSIRTMQSYEFSLSEVAQRSFSLRELQEIARRIRNPRNDMCIDNLRKWEAEELREVISIKSMLNPSLNLNLCKAGLIAKCYAMQVELNGHKKMLSETRRELLQRETELAAAKAEEVTVEEVTATGEATANTEVAAEEAVAAAAAAAAAKAVTAEPMAADAPMEEVRQPLHSLSPGAAPGAQRGVKRSTPMEARAERVGVAGKLKEVPSVDEDAEDAASKRLERIRMMKLNEQIVRRAEERQAPGRISHYAQLMAAQGGRQRR